MVFLLDNKDPYNDTYLVKIVYAFEQGDFDCRPVIQSYFLKKYMYCIVKEAKFSSTAESDHVEKRTRRSAVAMDQDVVVERSIRAHEEASSFTLSVLSISGSDSRMALADFCPVSKAP